MSAEDEKDILTTGGKVDRKLHDTFRVLFSCTPIIAIQNTSQSLLFAN